MFGGRVGLRSAMSGNVAATAAVLVSARERVWNSSILPSLRTAAQQRPNGSVTSQAISAASKSVLGGLRKLDCHAGKVRKRRIVLKNSKIGPGEKLVKLKSAGKSPLDTISVLMRTSHAA